MTVKTFRLGVCQVDITPECTYTKFPDGQMVLGWHEPQKGQDKLAKDMGYRSAYEMNVHHDLTHTLVSTMIGLPYSCTMRGIADKNFWRHHRREEAAILGVQQLALAAGIDLLKVAETYSRKD